MTTLTLEVDPVIVGVTVTNEKLIVELEDGRSIAIPLEWYPRLLHGTVEERQNYQLLGDGYAIEWPELDEHIGIEGVLAGRRSSESRSSLERWLGKRRVEQQ
ncbi:DUF2442 domain-containing protein [Candidatus Parcubacteria bacterium]|nr:MAG: DUF2442 domain-containing protein [Candidatus Parcubacteria bacterium]